jgi:NADPH-dependent ferric siderophore reductase
MAERKLHKLVIGSKKHLTPNMLRLTLSGVSLEDFPAGAVGGYMKVLVPKTEVDVSALEIDAVDLGAFVKRSYTIRSVDSAQRSLVLDFVAHADAGPATAWVQAARPGDHALLGGPGPVKMLDPTADSVFLAGDMTALPAIGANLERLPPHMRGSAVIEVLSEEDKQPLEAPAGVAVHWVVTADVRSSRLVDEVRQKAWGDGRVSVWAASEFASMKGMRAYFQGERGVKKDDMYISSYWKLGSTDEQHKMAKRAEAVPGG